MAQADTLPRTRRTDRALSYASIRVAAEEGWRDFTFARVAREAGTSRRPLQDRYADRSELAATTWSDSAEPVIRGLLIELLASAGLLTHGREPDRFVSVLDALAHPTPELQAAVELLIVAHFDDEVCSAVRRTLGDEIAGWCRPQPGGLTAEDAARRAYAVSAGLGLVLMARRPGIERVDVRRISEFLLSIFTINIAPRDVPLVDTPHIDEPVPFDTGDEIRDRLLQATLDEVGERGYEAATVDSIAHRANSSQGALFARYPTKVTLFLDAARRQAAYGLRANDGWMARIEQEHGRGVAEAAFIRESQRPHRHRLRVVTLEQIRIGWHEPDVRQAVTFEYEAFIAEAHATRPDFDVFNTHVGLALGGGTLMLPLLAPDAWLLPYDVVTVAWEG
jgi:AcrR family transcriptional regulator